ncbi:hypothetical protein AXX17_AT4G09410 [Arabidopsis thaliana]|uniref:Zinc knuckle CX2CX4HX4C domain-containing protein n=1 Tax=Arabidopsis thaliana TaxID=3702 RepID=A0A178UV37_ARATH|nr:hypothetical protein AXX17_AT4G09410 [Arabidopsis thaliana]
MMDYHDATSTQIVYIRVRIRFGITHKLRFFQRIIFEYGETAIIRFQYERLKRISPLTPPPRVAPPPLNHEELAAAIPYFATTRDAHNIYGGSLVLQDNKGHQTLTTLHHEKRQTYLVVAESMKLVNHQEGMKLEKYEEL